MVQRKSVKNGLIELMRFIFSVVIVIDHARNLGGGSDNALFLKGYLGVEFFFIVSGYLMAQSASGKASFEADQLGEETALFIFHKIESILPYYIPALICSLIWISIGDPVHLQKFSTGIWDICFLKMSGIQTITIVSASWYISAMLIAMSMLYPLLRKYKDSFLLIIAPLSAFLILGYLSQSYGHLNLFNSNFSFLYSGLLRAIAEICLGCFCWKAVSVFRRISLTKFGCRCVYLLTLLCYLGAFIVAQFGSIKSIDYVFVFFIFFAILGTFWKCNFPFFSHPIFDWLGRLSIAIYLNHRWVQFFIRTYLPETLGYWKLLAIFLVCASVVSVVQMGVAKLITQLFRSHIRPLFILQKG